MGTHRRRSQEQHRRSNAQPYRRNASIPVVERRALPPTPVQLLCIPDAGMQASDGTVSVPLLSDGPECGWTVFDVHGRMVELLVFQRGQDLVAEDIRFLAVFEESRANVGDPQFAAYDPRLRKREAHHAPDGDEDVLCAFYDHSPEPARDGSRSVLVYSWMQPDAWLVLDRDGRLVEGTYFPPDSERRTPVGDRFRAFLARRLRVEDPFVRSQPVRPESVRTDKLTAGDGGER